MLKLAQLSKGDRAEIVGLEAGDKAYRSRLLALGLIPGTEFCVVRFAPLGDPIEILIRGYILSLRKNEAGLLRVKRLAHHD